MVSIIFFIIQFVVSSTHQIELSGLPIGFALVQLKANRTSSPMRISLVRTISGNDAAEKGAVQVPANFTGVASSDADTITESIAGSRKRAGAPESAGRIAKNASVHPHPRSTGGSSASDDAQDAAATKLPIEGPLPVLLRVHLQVKNSTLPWHMDIFGRMKEAEAPARALLYADSGKWTLLTISVIVMILLDYLILEPMSRRREPLPVNVETALEDTYKCSSVFSKSLSRKVIMQLCRRSSSIAELFGVSFPDEPSKDGGKTIKDMGTCDKACQVGGQSDENDSPSEEPCQRGHESEDDFSSLPSEDPCDGDDEFDEVVARRFELLGESMDSAVNLEELKSFYRDEIQPMSSSTFTRHIFALIFWVGLAGAFNVIVWERMGTDAAWQFSSGYILEWLLSMDNLFVFHLIFKMYRTPRELVHKALFAGIVGALLFRMVAFVALTEVMSMLSWARFAFGIFLTYSGVMTAIGDDDDEADVGNNFLVVMLERALGERILKRYDKRGILVSIGGKLHATLLLPVIVCIEVSDILFAVDSVSAKVAQIPDYYLSYSSSIFAMFGLRAMFFIVQEMVDMFDMLKYGLSFILVFIGAELIFSDYIEVPAQTVCALICGVFAICIGASLLTRGGHDDKEKC